MLKLYWSFKFEDKRKTFPKIKGRYLEKIPICKTSGADKRSIITLAQRIVSIKKEDLQADTSALQNEIDKKVYRLYGLTYDEVLIVDPNPPFTREEYETARR